MNLRNSAFKMPLAPPPHPPSEALLFHDILEEKTMTLRNIMNDFLQVQPYRKFENEFSNFIKRTKQIMLEGQRNGANISRLTNSSQIIAMNSRPSSSFNYRPSTTMSMMNSNRNSTLRLPETNFQPVVQLNPFKPPMEFQPVLLPPIDQSFYGSCRSPTLCNTVVAVNQLNNNNSKTTNVREISQYPELHESAKHLQKSQLDIPNTYSDITITENKSVNSLHQIENNNDGDDDDDDDGTNSIESLMDNVGFKIVVGIPNNIKNKTLRETDEKFLSKWSLNMKRLQSSCYILLTGTLMEQDQVTVKEKLHDAGILLARKSANLVRTKKGFYNLIGNIIGGSPNELYQICLAVNGIPKNWRNSLKKCNADVGKNNKNTILDFSLDSPAGPLKPKTTDMLNMSITRNGKSYNSSLKTVNKNNTGKRKSTDSSQNDTNIQRKQRKFYDKLPPMLASTPKRPKSRPSVFQTPTQILKNKLCRKVNNHQSNAKSNSRLINTHNDSINVIKKRQSNSKEQSNILLKSTKSIRERSKNGSNTSEKQHSRQVIDNIIADSVNNLKLSKQMSINSSNSNVTQSKSKTSRNSSTMINSNSTATRSNLKTSVNSTKNSSVVNNVKKTKQITPTGQKKIIHNCVPSSEVPNKNKGAKTVKEMTTRKLDKTNAPKELKIKQKTHSKGGSSSELGIFGDVDFAEDHNIMMSPSKLSVTSHTNKSRSSTPPLFNNQLGNAVCKSIVVSEPPTPLSKSVEAKALKRIKQPRITVEEELKTKKRTNNKQANYKITTDRMNKMLEYGTEFSDSDN